MRIGVSSILFALFLFNHVVVKSNKHNLETHQHDLHNVWDITSVLPAYPRPHNNHNRIFAMILAFNFNRIESILDALQEYRNMCEAGWLPTVNFLTSVDVSERIRNYLHAKTYCYRIQRSVSIVYRQHNATEKFLLSEHNREYVAQYLNSHDLFIYQEEDTVLSLGHVMAYLDETKRLIRAAYNDELMKSKGRRLSSAKSSVTASVGSSSVGRDSMAIAKTNRFHRKPSSDLNANKVFEPKIDKSYANNTLRTYMIGFQRYYRVRSPNDLKRKNYTIEDDELFRSEQLNEIPFLYPACIYDQPYLESRSSAYTYIGQPHQAVYILTRDQVHILHDKCKFLDQRISNLQNDKFLDYAREYTSSLSLFENNIITEHSCGLKKLSPPERMIALSIEHYYPTFTEQPNHPLFVVSEHVQAGLAQTESPTVVARYYDNLLCWKDIIGKHRGIGRFDNLNSTILAAIPRHRQIFLVENGVKRAIKDMDTFEKYGFSKDNITLMIYPDALNAMPNGKPLT